MKFTLKYSGDIYPEIPMASSQLVLGWVRAGKPEWA